MYELCCDMIDLLINMSEIYGKPNENNIRSLNDDDEDDEQCINDEQYNEPHEWNIESLDDDDENNVQMNGLRGNSYMNSKFSV
jgi:hypothetical protein